MGVYTDEDGRMWTTWHGYPADFLTGEPLPSDQDITRRKSMHDIYTVRQAKLHNGTIRVAVIMAKRGFTEAEAEEAIRRGHEAGYDYERIEAAPVVLHST